MSFHLSKKAIVKKTIQVGSVTFLSRFLAIAREFLQISFFGINALSDAFITAFKIPNFFRHMFAEGALNASFVPVFVQVVKQEDRETANGLITIALMFFQGILLLLYLLILVKTDMAITFIAPGFSGEQVEYAITFLRILFPFIFLVSMSALFGCALNAVNHFFVPAFGPALWNMMYVATLLICLVFKLSPMYLCLGVIVAGMVQLALNAFAFFKYNFNFGAINRESWGYFKQVLSKFFPYLMGVSIVEINLFVGGMIASFLPKGSVSLLYYSSRFMNIPLGVFAVAFSSIMLPHFSRLVLYAPKRMSFYILEVAKFVSWVIIPVTLFLVFIAQDLFKVLFLIKKVTPEQAMQAQGTLIIYLGGLLFFCLNKIFLSMLYSLKDSRSTVVITSVGALVNLLGDFVGIYFWGIYGIAAAAGVSGACMTVLCLVMLKKQHKFTFYAANYGNFLIRYVCQLAVLAALFWAVRVIIFKLLEQTTWHHFFVHSFGSWLLLLPLTAFAAVLLFLTKNFFGIRMHFLSK